MKNDKKECFYTYPFTCILKYWKWMHGYKFDYRVIILFLANRWKSYYIAFDDFLKYQHNYYSLEKKLWKIGNNQNIW